MPKLSIPDAELMEGGHAGCPGCGAALAMRYLLKGFGENVSLSIPACCWTVIGMPFPMTVFKVPVLDNAFEATGAAISGVRAGLDAQGKKDVTVIGFAGDGGTADIGLQALSGMLERRTDAVYVMYDNEAYMNTGIQRSGSTPMGAWTTTTPVAKTSRGKAEPKKDIFEIVLAHRPAYAATANVAFPEDYIKKAKKAAAVEGPRFFHVLAPCPAGWRFPSEKTVAIGRLATDTNVFPLMEYEGGKLRLTRKPSKRTPLADYLKVQGRFAHFRPEEVDALQGEVDLRWQGLLARETPAKAPARVQPQAEPPTFASPRTQPSDAAAPLAPPA